MVASKLIGSLVVIGSVGGAFAFAPAGAADALLVAGAGLALAVLAGIVVTSAMQRPPEGRDPLLGRGRAF